MTNWLKLVNLFLRKLFFSFFLKIWTRLWNFKWSRWDFDWILIYGNIFTFFYRNKFTLGFFNFEFFIFRSFNKLFEFILKWNRDIFFIIKKCLYSFNSFMIFCYRKSNLFTRHWSFFQQIFLLLLEAFSKHRKNLFHYRLGSLLIMSYMNLYFMFHSWVLFINKFSVFCANQIIIFWV